MTGKQITVPSFMKMCTDSVYLLQELAPCVIQPVAIHWTMNIGQKMSIVSVTGVPTVVSTSAAVLMLEVTLTAALEPVRYAVITILHTTIPVPTHLILPRG